MELLSGGAPPLVTPLCLQQPPVPLPPVALRLLLLLLPVLLLPVLLLSAALQLDLLPPAPLPQSIDRHQLCRTTAPLLANVRFCRMVSHAFIACLRCAGELFNRIVDKGPFPEEEAADLFAQILLSSTSTALHLSSSLRHLSPSLLALFTVSHHPS